MKELPFQTEILRSAKKTGGYGHKISDRFKVGVPDLLVAMPNSGLVLLECKALGVVTDEFDKKTGVTAIQQETLNKYNATQLVPLGAQLIYMVHRGVQRAIVWPAHLDSVSWKYEEDRRIWVERQRGFPNWNVAKIVEAVKLMK